MTFEEWWEEERVGRSREEELCEYEEGGGL